MIQGEDQRKGHNLYLLPCYKTRGHKPPQGQQKAIVFLKLRDAGCDSREALRFAKKVHCKSDTTQVFNGPRSKRILLNKYNKLYANNILNGWLMNIEQEYSMGKRFIMDKKDVLQSDEQDEKMAIDLQAQNNSLKHDYKQREKYLERYFQEVEEKYDFSRVGREVLHEKLQQLIQNAHASRIGSVSTGPLARECYKIKSSDVNLFEIVEVIKQQEKNYAHPMGQYPQFMSENQQAGLEKSEFLREEKPVYMDLYLAKSQQFVAGSFRNIQPQQFSKEAQIRAAQEKFNESVYLISNPQGDKQDLPAVHKKKGHQKKGFQKGNHLKNHSLLQQRSAQTSNADLTHGEVSASASPRAAIEDNEIDQSKAVSGSNKQLSPEEIEFQNKMKGFIHNHIDLITDVSKCNFASSQISDSHLRSLLSVKSREQKRYAHGSFDVSTFRHSSLSASQSMPPSVSHNVFPSITIDGSPLIQTSSKATNESLPTVQQTKSFYTPSSYIVPQAKKSKFLSKNASVSTLISNSTSDGLTKK